MYKLKDQFEYFECADCGCLQIKKIPSNLSRYYPQNYYSFQQQHKLNGRYLKSLLKSRVAKNSLYNRNFIGMILSKKYEPPNFCNWFRKVKINIESEILDVGSGTGERLLEIQRAGFINLTGIDPYLRQDISYKNGVKIFKKNIEQLQHQFDFIMLNHSFEHMNNPLSVLRQLHRILKPDRFILIRTPVASSFSWRHYGINWVQLDAPRHLFLHTPKSIKIMTSQAGLELADIVFDSTELQFWGSEQYIKDIAILDNNSYVKNPKKSIFTKKQIRQFKTKAVELNENHDGDSACFYLYKKHN